jgi:SAM-dependent methyltransferase
MINADGNALRRIDLWLDLRNRLPFPNDSVAFVYCSHTLEHLYPDDAIRLLREMRRVVSPCGCVRIAVPSLDRALDIIEGRASFELGRKFVDPCAQALDYLFCLGQHKYGYCFELLADFAREAGFSRITNYSLASGVAPKRYGKVVVGNEPAGSLVVELGKQEA